MADDFNLKNILAPESVVVLKRATKEEVLNKLIDIMAQLPAVSSKEELANGIFSREELMSTGIGLNLGIPHVRLDSISGLNVAVALVSGGVEGYESLDSLPVKLVFMIVARTDQNATHLRLLSQLSSSLKGETRREELMQCRNAEALYRALTR